jgi:hypothetical protein
MRRHNDADERSAWLSGGGFRVRSSGARQLRTKEVERIEILFNRREGHPQAHRRLNGRLDFVARVGLLEHSSGRFLRFSHTRTT